MLDKEEEGAWAAGSVAMLRCHRPHERSKNPAIEALLLRILQLQIFCGTGHRVFQDEGVFGALAFCETQRSFA